MKMIFSANLPIQQPPILITPKPPIKNDSNTLPNAVSSFQYFNRAPMFQRILSAPNCASCNK